MLICLQKSYYIESPKPPSWTKGERGREKGKGTGGGKGQGRRRYEAGEEEGVRDEEETGEEVGVGEEVRGEEEKGIAGAWRRGGYRYIYSQNQSK